MAGNTIDLARIVHERIAPMVALYGLELPAFYIENISLPAEVEAALDKRTATSVAGDLSRYTDFSAAEAMTKAAENPSGGGGIGAGMGMGMGMAMAERMARKGPWGEAPATAGEAPAPAAEAPPPPPPPATQWHVAENGQARGPFGVATLAQMAGAGDFTPETYVWRPGAAGWTRAAEVPELAAVFAQMPPPPPPG